MTENVETVDLLFPLKVEDHNYIHLYVYWPEVCKKNWMDIFDHLPDWLMLHNSIMIKFLAVWHCFSPRVAFAMSQYMQCILHRPTSVLLCVSFIFADNKKCWFGGGTWWLSFTVCIMDNNNNHDNTQLPFCYHFYSLNHLYNRAIFAVLSFCILEKCLHTTMKWKWIWNGMGNALCAMKQELFFVHYCRLCPHA